MKIEPKKIRWVLAHEPIDLFLRAANRFASVLEKQTNGAISIEIMTVSEYSQRYNGGTPVSRHSLLALMNEGKIEMSQMYTTTLAEVNPEISVLDLPFLFRDHDHAAKVLDGEIGQNLLAGLSARSKIQGLAFTYSGGYRMLVGNQSIRKVSDFKGLRIRTAKSAVAEATFRAVGALPVALNLEDLNSGLSERELHCGESTYPRFYSMKQNEVSTFINDTQHSLFLTSILINSDFWNSLDPKIQQLISETALASAVDERRESVDDIALTQVQCRADGIEIVTLPENETSEFKRLTESVYHEFDSTFAPGLIKKIQNS